MQIGEKWMRWTFAEAGTKTASKLLQKVVGVAASSWIYAMFATAVISIVQVMSGLIVVKSQKKSLFPDFGQVAGSCLFGLFAFISTVLAFTVFVYNGDVGVNTFIITLSIVPGAFIDRIFFGHKLNWRQWAGVVVAIVAGYSVLGFPSLSTALAQPAWVWLSFGITMSVAINQGITQKVKKVDPFVKNFWGGLTTLALAVAGLAVMGSLGTLLDFSVNTRKLWIVSGLMGFIIVGMWSFNLLSYKGGASIAIKKLVMNGAYLITAMLGGLIFFHERLTVGKCSGVLLFFAAFTLMDKGTWEYFSRLWKPSNPVTVLK